MYLLIWALLLTLPAALAWRWPSLENVGIAMLGFDTSDTCGYTRDDALLCIAKYVDTNGDREISEAEFEHARDTYLPRQARAAHWIAHKLGFDVTMADVKYGCDIDHDNRLTLSDWENGAKKCLPGKGDLCKLKTVCDIAEKMNVQHPR